MATRDDVYTALRNADAAGDTASVQKLAAYLKTMPDDSAPSVHDQVAARIANDPISQGAADPTSGMSGTQKFFAGWGKSAVDLATGAKQRVDDAAAWLEPKIPGMQAANNFLGLQSAQTIRDQGRAAVDAMKPRDAPLMATGAGRTGNLIGGVVDSLPLGRVTGPSWGGAIGQGAVQGALQPTGTNDSAVANATLGAGLGAAGKGLLNTASAIAKPVIAKGAQALKDAGIELTPGQLLGGGWKRTEDALTSVPFVGDLIKNAQRRSFQGFNTAVGNQALEPIGAKMPAGVTGNDAIQYVEKTLGGAYDSALGKIGTIRADQQFQQGIGSLAGMVKNGNMDPAVAKQFDNILQNQVLGKFQGQTAITAQTMKDMEGELGRLASKFQRDPSADKQLLGDAIQEMQGQLRGLVQRNAPPGVSEELQAANLGWANFKRMQRAASSLGAEEGTFTPAQYLNAVKALDKSKDKAQFARGDALGQDLAATAKSVMGSTVPDSGTPFRTLVTSGIPGATSAAVASPLAALYTPTGQRLAQLALTKRPALAGPVAETLDKLAPYLGVGSTNLIGNRAGQGTP